MLEQPADAVLAARFRDEVAERVPHLDAEKRRVANATPLVDVTGALVECAAEVFGLDLSVPGVRVFGKFDSGIFGGSVKVRPAVQILTEAIDSGKLRGDMTVFEATSGNFGLALAMLGRLGLRVVALVSRKLQPGVTEVLTKEGVKLVNLDVDICPAPGQQGDPDILLARGVAASVRQQLAGAGLDPLRFDDVRTEAESLLAVQDVFGLARLLASAYGGFCPQQYENELNVRAHEDLTGPEIAQQLEESGANPSDFETVCAFGTGGTATGLSRFGMRAYGRKSVRVVFPLSDQDVAGVRTREKASGLRFYRPELYVSEHQVDFEKARRLQGYFIRRGYDIGESGALVLYACMELVNYGAGRRLVALIADGSAKYAAAAEPAVVEEVSLQQAAARKGNYAAVVWTHGSLSPKPLGVSAIAESLGVDAARVRVAKVSEIQTLFSGGEVPSTFSDPAAEGKLLLVCMMGGTSLMVAKTLARKGIAAESLLGGIAGLPAVKGKPPFDYIQQARE